MDLDSIVVSRTKAYAYTVHKKCPNLWSYNQKLSEGEEGASTSRHSKIISSLLWASWRLSSTIRSLSLIVVSKALIRASSVVSILQRYAITGFVGGRVQGGTLAGERCKIGFGSFYCCYCCGLEDSPCSLPPGAIRGMTFPSALMRRH